MRLSKILTNAAPAFAAMFATLLFAGAARADRFSATMVFDEGGYVTESKVYVHNENYRIEPGQSYEPVLIARKDDNVMFRIDRDTGYVSQDIFRMSDLPVIIAPPNSEDTVSQGEDEFDGVACTKYKTTLLDIGGNEVKQIWWIDKYVGRLMKVQAEDESWTYYLKDLDVGNQDPALFEDPAGAVIEEGAEEGDASAEYEDDGEEYGDYGDEDSDSDSEYGDDGYDDDESYSDDEDTVDDEDSGDDEYEDEGAGDDSGDDEDSYDNEY